LNGYAAIFFWKAIAKILSLTHMERSPRLIFLEILLDFTPNPHQGAALNLDMDPVKKKTL
jgi:hypothetical protein